jgi:hypothetical protein
MTTKRLNVNVPVDQHRDFHLFAISQGASMSDLVNQFVADEPVIERLRGIVSDLNSGDVKAPPPDIQAGSSYRTMQGAVWEYRLPSGRIAKVVKTPSSGSFLSH